MKKLILGLLLVSAVSACAVSPQRLAADECKQLGLPPGTTQFMQCYQQSMNRRQASSMAMTQAGLQMMQQGYPQQPAAVAPSQMICRNFAGQMTCNAY